MAAPPTPPAPPEDSLAPVVIGGLALVGIVGLAAVLSTSGGRRRVKGQYDRARVHIEAVQQIRAELPGIKKQAELAVINRDLTKRRKKNAAARARLQAQLRALEE